MLSQYINMSSVFKNTNNIGQSVASILNSIVVYFNNKHLDDSKIVLCNGDNEELIYSSDDILKLSKLNISFKCLDYFLILVKFFRSKPQLFLKFSFFLFNRCICNKLFHGQIGH